MDVDLIEVGRRKPLERFRDFAEPGYAKIVSELSVRGLEDGGTLLAGLMRTATTDEHARRWFRRDRTFGVGSGAHIRQRRVRAGPRVGRARPGVS